jgi:pyrimidine-nucleoside phosphorylase
MNSPLGDNVGNALEVLEALDVLKGKNGMLRNICIELSSVLYSRALSIDINEAKEKVTKVLDNGTAYNKFLEFVKMQGGDIDKIEVSKYLIPVKSNTQGTLKGISAQKIGYLSLELGAGRIKKEDSIDYGVGIVINKHLGDTIKVGDTLCYLYQNNEKDYKEKALDAFTIVK